MMVTCPHCQVGFTDVSCEMEGCDGTIMGKWLGYEEEEPPDFIERHGSAGCLLAVIIIFVLFFIWAVNLPVGGDAWEPAELKDPLPSHLNTD